MRRCWSVLFIFGFAAIGGCNTPTTPDQRTTLNQGGSYEGRQLVLAVLRGNTAKVRELVESGIPIDAAEQITGRTPLHWAAMAGQEEIAIYLIDQGAPLEARDELNQTPLFDAVVGGKDRIVARLLARGARTDVKDKYGQPILVAAANPNNEGKSTFEILLTHGLDVNQSGGLPHNATALHWVAYYGMIEEVRYLLTNGADVHALDSEGMTPRDWAEGRNRHEVVETLTRAMDAR